ncbi:hypothetical protein HYV71_03220 [Candidatus Uhrbacteria bacterium]|nr:hypothetical protein [Candidatus Uhrbacteria bacterium]
MAEQKTLHLILKKTLNVSVEVVVEAIEKLEGLPSQTLNPKFFQHTAEEPFERQRRVQEIIKKGEVVLVDAETYFGSSEVNGIPKGKFYVVFPGDTVHLYEVGPRNPFRRVWPELDPVS